MKAEFQKEYTDIYGKSWDELVKLAKNNELKTSSIIVHWVEDENNCKKDPNYLDNRKSNTRRSNKKKK